MPADGVLIEPHDLARLPLLQQSTRPQACLQWFESAQVEAASPLAGPRYELFSMTVAAATHAMGFALVPRLLIEHELTSGQLVQACRHALPANRAYYLVTPERTSVKPAMQLFQTWLARQSHSASATT